MEKSDFLNTPGEGPDVTEVLAVESANPNGGNWNRFVHVFLGGRKGIQDARRTPKVALQIIRSRKKRVAANVFAHRGPRIFVRLKCQDDLRAKIVCWTSAEHLT
jgi:hypothetical protein